MLSQFERYSLAAVILFLGVGVAVAGESDDVEVMVHEFLATSHLPAAHAAFWAEDLIYTSSDGTRFGKADIMSGYEDGEAPDETPTVTYSGEDMKVRIYGDAAVVTFKLVGTPVNESAEKDVLYYFNTGTLLKRGGVWQVVAWQATKIPPR